MTKTELALYALRVAAGVKALPWTCGMNVNGKESTVMPDGTRADVLVSHAVDMTDTTGAAEQCDRVGAWISSKIAEFGLDRFIVPDYGYCELDVVAITPEGIRVRAVAMQDFCNRWSVRFEVLGGRFKLPATPTLLNCAMPPGEL